MMTNKFAPSGSLKDEKSIFEQRTEVMPKIMNEFFFEFKCILTIFDLNFRNIFNQLNCFYNKNYPYY